MIPGCLQSSDDVYFGSLEDEGQGSVPLDELPWLSFSAELADFAHGAFVELQGCGRNIFFQMRDAGCAGDRKHDRGAAEQPGESQLRRRNFQLRRDTRQFAAGRRNFPGG
jgi:hypothetical protein